MFLPVVNKVIITPLRILHVLFECVEHIEKCQMVSIYVGKSQLGVIRGFLCFIGPERDK